MLKFAVNHFMGFLPMKKRYMILAVVLGMMGGCTSAPSPSEKTKNPAPAAGCSSASRCEDLGIRYITGDGVRIDGTRAARYLEKACSYGSASACNTAAFIYANAEGGAKQDYTKAMRYWSRACRLGDESGCANYKLAQDKLAALRAGKYR
jgi:TPR repeat protein